MRVFLDSVFGEGHGKRIGSVRVGKSCNEVQKEDGAENVQIFEIASSIQQIHMTPSFAVLDPRHQLRYNYKSLYSKVSAGVDTSLIFQPKELSAVISFTSDPEHVRPMPSGSVHQLRTMIHLPNGTDDRGHPILSFNSNTHAPFSNGVSLHAAGSDEVDFGILEQYRTARVRQPQRHAMNSGCSRRTPVGTSLST